MDVTLFEVHLDGATFGPTFESEHDEPADHGEAEVGSEEGGRSRLLLLVPAFVFLGVAAGIAVALRRRGGAETGTETDDALGEPVEIDA